MKNKFHPGLTVHTQLKAGWKDFIRTCQGTRIITDVGADRTTQIQATCYDLNSVPRNTWVEFPNRYEGVVQNCDGVLTAGGCG
jgi:hypothetical protein